MFTIQPITNPRDQKQLRDRFDPAESSWIVSDLKSKLDLNRALLQDREFLSGETVLRASELWKLLLLRLRPDLQFISREFALTLIAQRLGSFAEAEATAGDQMAMGSEVGWMKAPGAAQTAYDYMSQLMPILSHPNGAEMITEWFAENGASQVRWGRWCELAQRLWNLFLDEGFIAPPWVPGVLVNESDLSSVWSRPLFMDLGAELTQVEADLLVLLSAHVAVTVLRLEPSWKAEYRRTLTAYETFDKKLQVPATTSAQLPAGPECESLARPHSRAPGSTRTWPTNLSQADDHDCRGQRGDRADAAMA